MSSQVLVYDRSGICLAELEANVKRTWKISEYSNATFSMSLWDAAAVRENMQFGNYLVVKHSSLPTWGGMIYPPRDWGNRTVTVNAFSGEFILRTRRGPSNIKMEGNGGKILMDLINIANKAGPTLLRAVQWEPIQPWMVKTLDATNLYEVMKTFTEASGGQEWTVEPRFDFAGCLYFEAQFYQKIGAVKFTKLLEGKNIELTPKTMSEQGEIVNDLVGYGSGASWDSKGFWQAVDQTSQNDFGLFQSSEQFTDDIQGTVQANTESKLKKLKNPAKTFDLKALDVDSLFQDLRLGNQFPIKLLSCGYAPDGSIGYEGNMRILGMTYDDLGGKVEMITEEVVS